MKTNRFTIGICENLGSYENEGFNRKPYPNLVEKGFSVVSVAGAGSYNDSQFHNQDLRIKIDSIKKPDFTFDESEDEIQCEMELN